MKQSKSNQKFDEIDEGQESGEDSPFKWSDLIFLPFHPVFKMFVLITVIVKSTMGPIQSVFTIVHCSDIMDQDIYLFFIKYFYAYFCDLIYCVDTFLHIVHRQVTETAMRREYLPKSAFLLLLDVISLVPFFTLMTSEICPDVQLWPNILVFSEFVIIYRVVEYFSLLSTHSHARLLIGYTILLLICINCIGCFLILLTINGLCNNCRTGMYDWRKYVEYKLNETDERLTTYVYGTSFMFSYVVFCMFDETKPSTIREYILVAWFMVVGYLIYVYVFLPKVFAESVLDLRRVCTFYPHVCRIVEETKRRNPSRSAYVNVNKFYDIMWKKRRGIIKIPDNIAGLPRYLRIDIRNDLVWPVFYHSPTLRKTSMPFKRWICDYICLEYKLPGEKFFVGPHCHTNMYYLKSGIVELLSADDGVTSLLSLTSGTVFGDVSFIVPPLKRTLVVRSVSYCEVYTLSRYDMLKAMQKYPVDRRNILASVKERLKHAHTLYTCKQHVRGLDRAEDEGLAWLKRRWWEISDAVSSWKKKPKLGSTKCELPPEEAVYHCAKYIGQLVLCTDLQLHKKSLFANMKFPWILTPNSAVTLVWKRIVVVTVFVVLITYPPNITSKRVRSWFKFIRVWTDCIYIADICISLMTASTRDKTADSFAAVMFARCKRFKFVLDIFSTTWFEVLALLTGQSKLYYIFQANRLIKVYVLFSSDYINEWSVHKEPFINVSQKIILTNFCHVYISAYLMYFLVNNLPNLTITYYFGAKYCPNLNDTRALCDLEESFFGVALSYIYEYLFFEYVPYYLLDIIFGCVIAYTGFLIYLVTKCTFVAYLYLKFREAINYQVFVSNLKKYYITHKIHTDLLKRLDRYLMCHWKYYQGADIMNPNMWEDEPFDIYWKLHGEVAEKIIGESQAFAGADPLLVRELAYASKFVVMPKNATIFLFGVQCRNVTWIVKGHLKAEYHDETGELVKTYHDPGEMVSVSAVLLRKPSIKTYATCTECELIYIKIQDFFNIIRRYPHEMSYFKNCIEECKPHFVNLIENYVKKHRDYQKKLRERIFHNRQSIVVKRVQVNDDANLSPFAEWDTWVDPDSDFMQYWMTFRAIVVVVSIVSSAMQGGSGALYRRPLMLVGVFCDCIAWIDIFLKMFMSYYNENGILIYDTRMCITHYLKRGFLLDLVGVLPWYVFFNMLLENEMIEQEAMFMNTCCKFSHMYILMAFFNHTADVPTINSVYVLILKWQMVILLLMVVGSHYLMNHCIEFTFDKSLNLLDMSKKNDCWIPAYMPLNEKPTVHQLHLLFAQSFNLAQSALIRMNLGKFHIDRNNLGVGFVLVSMGIAFWYVLCYSLTLLILSNRFSTVFQHGVSQLQKFLNNERVDKPLIDEAVAHFTYWWWRNKGIDRHRLMNERIGLVFRQDLSYYFFKKTFVALDTLLDGGEQLQRQLSSLGQQWYLRPGQEIMREMDLTPQVFVVHRGKVNISRDGVKLAELTKGSIFGQLDGTHPRPVKASARTEGYSDVLLISIGLFQDTITDEVRRNIAHNRTSKHDYMAMKNIIAESPHNTIEYIMKGKKTIQLPWMKEPCEARTDTWYYKWLFLAWVLGPVISAVIVLLLCYLPEDQLDEIVWTLIAFDVLHLVLFITEVYNVQLTVVEGELVNRHIGFRILQYWSFYVDMVSLLLPYMTFVTGEWGYQLARLLRLRLFYEFNRHFGVGFKSRLIPIFMKFILVLLLLHAMTCGWIYVACRNEGPFPVPIMDPPNYYDKKIDRDEWVDPRQRSQGCSRMTMNFRDNNTGCGHISFVVPRHWYHDYIVAMLYILLLATHTVLDTVVALSIKEIYYKIVVHWIVFLLDLWLTSTFVSAVYTNYRELFQYDFSVSNLTTYLRHSGLSPPLLRSVQEYTRQLWRRQRGNWLPELARQAPLCLQEDLFSALYIHHLKRPLLFRKLPPYFIRQVVARFQRLVVFPGKCIVEEGDIFPCMYFIHEGEVEKCYKDPSGEKKVVALLTTNGYFGLVPGLFPNVPFQFSYYSRTVVDIVYLRLNFWQDLLTAYPDIRNELYACAKQLKRELSKKV